MLLVYCLHSLLQYYNKQDSRSFNCKLLSSYSKPLPKAIGKNNKADRAHPKLVLGRSCTSSLASTKSSTGSSQALGKAPCTEHSSIPCSKLHMEESFKLDTSLVSQTGVEGVQAAYAWPHSNSLTQGERRSSWAHEQGKGYISHQKCIALPKAAELLGTSSSQEGVCFTRWSALPSSDALERGSLGKAAPRNAVWTHRGESCTVSWPSPRCSSPALQRGSLQLPDHLWLAPSSQREEHHVCRPMRLVHGPVLPSLFIHKSS